VASAGVPTHVRNLLCPAAMTEAVAFEAWDVGGLRVVVGSERWTVQQGAEGPEEVMVDLALDYATTWSEEDRGADEPCTSGVPGEGADYVSQAQRVWSWQSLTSR
jgi:hypothetical protein